VTARSRGWRAWLPEVAALIALVAVHGASLTTGELRGDDFQFLREAREPIGETLLRPWGGHVFPLWRLEALAAYHLWGLDPIPYRWWLFVQVTIVSVLALRVLAAWGVGGPGRMLAAVMLGAWAQWSQVLSGYWTLSISVKVWVFTFLAVLGVLHEGAPFIRRSLIATGTLLAALEDPAGIIAIPAVAGALVLRRPLPVAGDARDPIAGWCVAILLVAAAVVAAGQALVSAVGSHVADLAMFGGGSRGMTMTFLLGPVVVGLTLAPSLAAVIPRDVVTPISWGASAVVMVVIAFAWWRAGSHRPAVAHAALMLAAGVALLGVTRPYDDFRFMANWTHYVLYLFLPVIALAGPAADAWCTNRHRMRGATPRTLMAAAGAVYVAAQVGGGALASRLRLMGAPAWERQMARGRTAAYTTIADSVLAVLAAAVPARGAVLQLPGAFLDLRFPREHPFFPLSFYSELGGTPPDRFRWVTPPLPASFEVSERDALASARPAQVVAPEFVRALRHAGSLRATYLAPVVFVAEPELPVACETLRRHGGAMAAGPAHRLLFDVPVPSADSMRLDARFVTAFRDVATYGVLIPPGTSGCAALDLVQVPELALSDTIRLMGVTGVAAARVITLGLFPPRP